MTYPNFAELIKYHPYHICTFANFADVTIELLEAALRGKEKLTSFEILKIARYTQIPVTVLTCPHLIMLDRQSRRHQKMVDSLCEKLIYIWEYQKKGNADAELFMKYHKPALVNLELAFLDGRASYAQYLGVKERVEQTLLSIKNSSKKPRELKTV